jgi:hypothetical protein
VLEAEPRADFVSSVGRARVSGEDSSSNDIELVDVDNEIDDPSIISGWIIEQPHLSCIVLFHAILILSYVLS